MTTYKTFFLIPQLEYEAHLARANSKPVRQVNNVDVNDGGKVVIRNDNNNKACPKTSSGLSFTHSKPKPNVPVENESVNTDNASIQNGNGSSVGDLQSSFSSNWTNNQNQNNTSKNVPSVSEMNEEIQNYQIDNNTDQDLTSASERIRKIIFNENKEPSIESMQVDTSPKLADTGSDPIFPTSEMVNKETETDPITQKEMINRETETDQVSQRDASVQLEPEVSKNDANVQTEETGANTQDFNNSNTYSNFAQMNEELLSYFDQFLNMFQQKQESTDYQFDSDRFEDITEKVRSVISRPESKIKRVRQGYMLRSGKPYPPNLISLERDIRDKKEKSERENAQIQAVMDQIILKSQEARELREADKLIGKVDSSKIPFPDTDEDLTPMVIDSSAVPLPDDGQDLVESVAVPINKKLPDIGMRDVVEKIVEKAIQQAERKKNYKPKPAEKRDRSRSPGKSAPASPGKSASKKSRKKSVTQPPKLGSWNELERNYRKSRREIHEESKRDPADNNLLMELLNGENRKRRNKSTASVNVDKKKFIVPA